VLLDFVRLRFNGPEKATRHVRKNAPGKTQFMPPRPLPIAIVAELLGTFLLVLFGCGAVHVAVLTGDLVGLWQVGIVWGVAIMLAIYVIGPISGAHINPAITLSFACWQLFPASRVVPYVVAQFVGAFLAAALLYFLFSPLLVAKETAKGIVRGQPGSEITAMCYGEYFPNPGPMAGGNELYDRSRHAQHNLLVSTQIACAAEFLGTAILALVVLAVTQPGHKGGPQNLAPVFIGLTVTVLICVIAPLTQACFNPARDFGPRMFAFLAGWREIALPGPRGWGSVLAVYALSPVAGAILGAGFHQLVLKQFVLNPQ
jgi:glycerol uptake facilitator protein